MISDRDLIIGLFEAVGALAERLTGSELEVRIIDSQTGERFWMCTPSDNSRWTSGDGLDTRAVLRAPVLDPSECSATHRSSRDEPAAKPAEVETTPQSSAIPQPTLSAVSE